MPELSDSVAYLQDPKFYLENFCKIKTKSEGLSSFILKEAQKDLFNALRVSNRVMILKCRQLGFSTAVTGYAYHYAITHPGVNVALIGYNSDLTKELLDKVKTFYRTTPVAMRPTIQYNSKFEISFPKLESKIMVLPSTEYVGRGYTLNFCLCVSGDTEVFLGDGDIKKVKDLNSGEEIINGNGGFSIVKYVLKKPNQKPLLGLTPSGSRTLAVTENHEVLIRGGEKKYGIWKRAKDVKVGDFIAFPYFQLRNRIDSISIPPNAERGRGSKFDPFSQDLIINRDFGRFVGWYLAEGTFLKNKIVLSIHEDEVKEILDLVKKTITPFVESVNVSYSKTSKTAVVYLYGKSFAAWVNEMFGGRALTKKLPRSIWNWGWDFGYGLLEGYIKGDGYIGDIYGVQMTSINKNLLYQFQRLLISLRIGFGGITKTECSRYGVKTQDRYDLRLGGKGNYKIRRKLGFPLPIFKSKSARWRTENTPGTNQGHGFWRRGRFHYWVKIKKTEFLAAESFVYDIVLDSEPHSFLTTSGVVHNCTELAFWENAEEKMAVLESSVPLDGKIVIETTPNSVGDYFYRMWKEDNGYVKKEYGWWWGYTREEIRQIAIHMNDPRRFAREYALDFMTSGRVVFDPDSIKRARLDLLRAGDKTADGTLVTEEDGVVVFHQPKEGGLYVLGADVAEGVDGGNYSTFSIFDRTTGEEVAAYRGHIAPDHFGEKIDKWGRKYNNALAVVEVNNHGLTTITTLKQLFYPSMYYRPSKFEAIDSSWSEKLGWRTTRITRPLMIDDLVTAVRDADIIIHNEHALDEMLTFIYNKHNDMEAQSGAHDDCLFAAALALQGFKVLFQGELDQLDYTEHLPKMFSY